MTLTKKIDKFFHVTERGSTFKTEVFAGLSVYLSLAYIFVVNPAILSQAGMPIDMVTVATILASAFAMILMGLWARLPFVLAPGLEMNSFFALVAVGTMGLTWQQGLGAVFWSGLLCLIFTLIPLRQKIIDAIPNGLKTAISFSVGVFVATIGLFLSGIVIFENSMPSDIGSLISAKALCLYIGLGISLILVHRLKMSVGFLVAIIVTAIVARYAGLGNTEAVPAEQGVFSVWKEVEFLVFSSQFLSVVVILFIIDFYGSIGKFIGLTASTNLTDKKGNMVDMKKAMGVDSIGTMAGSMVGTSNIITYVESAVGIAAGGRTGIVALVCAALSLLSLFFTPLIKLVPVEATAGILIYVGYRLMPVIDKKKGIGFDAAIAYLMGAISFLTFSLDKALLLGFAAYSLRGLIKKEKMNKLAFLLASTLIILVSVGSQFYLKR